MCPPMPSDSRLARTTIASAFQRIEALDAALDARGRPGTGTCSADGIVLMYGVVAANGTRTPASAGPGTQGFEQPDDPALVALLQDVVERIEPFAGFDGFERRGIVRSEVLHVRILRRLYLFYSSPPRRARIPAPGNCVQN